MFDSLNIYIGRNVKRFKIIAPMKIKKPFEILLWYCRKRAKRCRQKTHNFLKKCIKTCHNNQQINFIPIVSGCVLISLQIF